MSEPPHRDSESLSLALERRLDEVCNRFEDAWAAGQRPAIETYLGEVMGRDRAVLLPELIRVAACGDIHAGTEPADRLGNWFSRVGAEADLLVIAGDLRCLSQ